MSFQQGLSGLTAAAKDLDVIGNNVANSSTVGFKQSQAQFADVYAASLSGAAGSLVGLGTRTTSIVQQFTQGNISVSSNPLDMAINGKGFFRMTQNGAITYTRNGQFQLDSNGYVTDSSGRRLTGFGTTTIQDPVTGQTVAAADTGTPLDLRIDPNAQSAPQATGGSGTGQGVNMTFNVDSRATAPTTAFVSTPASPIPDPTSYNSATSIQTYDSLGNPHTMTLYFRKTTTANLWAMYTAVDGTSVNNSTMTGGVVGEPVGLQFTTSGTLATNGYIIGGTWNGGTNTITGGVATALTPAPTMSVDLNQVATDLGKTNGAASPQAFAVDLSKSTQYGSNFTVSAATQDGYTSGRLSGFSISPNGAVLARYTNGKSNTLGFVRLSNFPNTQGLLPSGDNQWVETAASGQALDGTPQAGSFGSIQSGAVEDSNVDLTQELVHMITAQRVYQANAQTIKTQDQVLNTLVNLR
ncbi:MAG TPA: flagellar hook protein FlgE [Betaproteobacteria bacterium]|nr:flagellar hook protein FlgE [Betaproteobacteria bacterium]